MGKKRPPIWFTAPEELPMERHNMANFVDPLEAICIENGFESRAEMNSLIAKVDITTGEKVAAFKNWQNTDATKEGLLALIESQKPPEIKSTFKIEGPVLIAHRAPTQMTILEVIRQLEDYNNLTSGLGKVFVRLAFQDKDDSTHHYCDDARSVGQYRYNESCGTVVSSECKGRCYGGGLTIATLLEALDVIAVQDEVLAMYGGDADECQPVNHVALYCYKAFDEEDGEWREGAICYLVGVRVGMSL